MCPTWPWLSVMSGNGATGDAAHMAKDELDARYASSVRVVAPAQARSDAGGQKKGMASPEGSTHSGGTIVGGTVAVRTVADAEILRLSGSGSGAGGVRAGARPGPRYGRPREWRSEKERRRMRKERARIANTHWRPYIWYNGGTCRRSSRDGDFASLGDAPRQAGGDARLTGGTTVQPHQSIPCLPPGCNY